MNDGGPAFPVPDASCARGMTMRDYFAGQIAASDRHRPWDGDALTARCLWYYRVADQMLVARDHPQAARFSKAEARALIREIDQIRGNAESPTPS